MKEALEEIAHQLTRIADQGEQVGMHLPWMQSQSHTTRTLRPTPTQAMAESISAHTSLETTPHRMDARQSRTHEARTELQTMQP